MTDETEGLVGFDNVEEVNTMAVPTLEQKYHMILEKSPRNGCGRFQVIASAIIMISLIGFGYIEYGLGYLELMPEFMCSLGGVD